MEIIITNPATNRKWKITPLDNGLCYQIFRTPWYQVDKKTGKRIGKNGHEVKGDWVFTEKYPTSLPYALELTLSLMLNDPDEPLAIDVKDPKNCGKQVAKEIKAWLNKLEVEVNNGNDGSDGACSKH